MKNKLVVVADDEREVAEFIQLLFISKNYQVVIVNNGQELVDTTKQLHPSIVISDLGMPVKDGAKAITELTSIYPDITYVVMSAIRNKDVGRVVSWIGGDFFIQKPFTEKDVFNLIDNIEEKRSLITKDSKVVS